jgi:hypothetical protein
MDKPVKDMTDEELLHDMITVTALLSLIGSFGMLTDGDEDSKAMWDRGQECADELERRKGSR